jgi:hypothetical protein
MQAKKSRSMSKGDCKRHIMVKCVGWGKLGIMSGKRLVYELFPD